MSKVAIVGAGPTGATLARLLVRSGIEVVLIEAASSFRRVFRGEALMPSGLDAIEQMGLTAVVEGLPHRPLAAWEIYIEGRQLFRVEEPMVANEPPCTLISQPALLEAIVTELADMPNFKFIGGTAVKDLIWQDERVVGVELGNGDRIAADLVIGADGRNSIVRERMQLTLEREPIDFDILWFKLPLPPQFVGENTFATFVSGRDAFGLFQGAEGQLQLGWSLHRDESVDWQQIDWRQKLAAAAPDWLADYVRNLPEPIERPLLLSISIGSCPRWCVPGGLIIGDAAHPMSPIRAQGINMALRDAIVTANHLISLHQQSDFTPAAIDRILPQIQSERSPEIAKIQVLQRAETAQARLLRNNPLLRLAASRLAPILRPAIQRSWLDRQLKLRSGVTEVKLKLSLIGK